MGEREKSVQGIRVNMEWDVVGDPVIDLAFSLLNVSILPTVHHIPRFYPLFHSCIQPHLSTIILITFNY